MIARYLCRRKRSRKSKKKSDVNATSWGGGNVYIGNEFLSDSFEQLLVFSFIQGRLLKNSKEKENDSVERYDIILTPPPRTI